MMQYCCQGFTIFYFTALGSIDVQFVPKWSKIDFVKGFNVGAMHWYFTRWYSIAPTTFISTVIIDPLLTYRACANLTSLQNSPNQWCIKLFVFVTDYLGITFCQSFSIVALTAERGSASMLLEEQHLFIT